MRFTLRTHVFVLCLAAAVSLGGAAAVGAQGRHGPPSVPPGQEKKPVTTTPPGTTPSSGSSSSGAPTSSGAATSSRLHTFGSWLDNANVNAPGEAWLSLSSAYWRSSSLREIDAPSMGISIGLAPRVQAGVSLPYYHVRDESGLTSHGFGASYIASKVVLSQEAPLKTAVSPTLEILNWSSPETGIHRVNWILPVSVQADGEQGTAYASTGYVSRGSVFGSGAVEWWANSRLTLVGSISHSYSVADDPISDALGITRHRTDAGGGAYVTVTPSLVLFTNVGRTFAPVDDTSSRLSLSAGIAVNIAGPATISPRQP
jgi:hypothetical protein